MKQGGSRLDGATLVVIDMQRAFRDEGQWQVPRYQEIVPVISRLQQALGSGAVFTRFVRDEAEAGAWAAYYRRWNGMRFPSSSEAWDITLDVPGGGAYLASMPRPSPNGDDAYRWTARGQSRFSNGRPETVPPPVMATRLLCPIHGISAPSTPDASVSHRLFP